MKGPKRFKHREVERAHIHAERLEPAVKVVNEEVEQLTTRLNKELDSFADELSEIIKADMLEGSLRVKRSSDSPFKLMPDVELFMIDNVVSIDGDSTPISIHTANRLEAVTARYKEAYLYWFKGPIAEMVKKQNAAYNPLLDLTMIHAPAGYNLDYSKAFVLFDDRNDKDISYFVVDLELGDILDMGIAAGFPKRVFLKDGFKHSGKLARPFAKAQEKCGANAYVADNPSRLIGPSTLMNFVKDRLVGVYDITHLEAAERHLKEKLDSEKERLAKFQRLELDVSLNARKQAKGLFETPPQVLYAGADFTEKDLERLALSAPKTSN